jgi:hypothetical protein
MAGVLHGQLLWLLDTRMGGKRDDVVDLEQHDAGLFRPAAPASYQFWPGTHREHPQ